MRISSVIAGIVVSALIGVLGFAPCRNRGIGIRDVTGTRVTETIWFGLFRQAEVTESPLAKWCAAHGISPKETDRFYSRTKGGFLGKTFIHGRQAVAAQFGDYLQEIYLRWEREPAIRKYLTQMSAADDAQKKNLVAAVINRALALENLHRAE